MRRRMTIWAGMCLWLLLPGIPADGSGGRQTLAIQRSPGTSGFDLSWEGRRGRSYFIQRSGNLTTWSYLPTVLAGDGTPETYWVASDGPSLFLRLRFTGIPTADPELADFDLDGLATMAELAIHGTDPLDADSDRDGIPDGREIDDATDPLDSSNGTPESLRDTDGDGIRDGLEKSRGTSPLLADSDGDGVLDGEDAFPLDPTRHSTPSPNPADTTAPVLTLDSPANAVPVP